MSFQKISGQPAAVRILQSAIEKDRVAHAYLFVGPSGVGRKLAARIYAQSLNCERFHDHNPCGTCASCRLVVNGNHPDIQIISPTKRSSMISVKQVEELLPFAYMRPIRGPYKVFILSQADRLGLEAANKLLKTLEEPPPSTVFILVTERPESMLPTVLSRCQPVKFGRLSIELVARILEADFGIDRERAAIGAELANGQITRALKFSDPKLVDTILGLVGSLETYSGRVEAYDALLGFLASQRERLSEEAEQTIPNASEELDIAVKASIDDLRKSFVDRRYREFLGDCLGLLLTFYRDVLVLRETKTEDLVINRNRIELLRECASTLGASEIGRNMEDIEEASEYCSHYVAEDRVFLDLLLKLRN